MRLLVSVVLSAFALGGCVSEAAKQRAEDQQLIASAQVAVANELRDPGSAVFSAVTVRDDTVCGEVRGKNGFGGYAAKTRFTYHRVTLAAVEPPENRFPLLRPEVSRTSFCVFDIEYRVCKGEVGLPEPITSCMAYLHDDVEDTAGTPVVTKALATSACLKALDARFNNDIRTGTLSSRSSRASVNDKGTWLVRVEWTADGSDFSGIKSAGTCAVNANGVARVSALNAE